MGATLADFQSSGTIPWFKVAWKKTVRGLAIYDAVSFKKRVEMPSGPEALLGFKRFKSL